MVEKITKGQDGVVSCLDKALHGFEDGGLVKFREVKGMTELNEESRVFEIKVINASSFSIGDTSAFSEYASGGIATEVKKAFQMSFLPLRQAIEEPEILVADWAKFSNPQTLHVGMQALDSFSATHSRLPNPWDAADASSIVQLAKEINEKSKNKQEALDEGLLRRLAYTSQGSIVPLTAFMGGVAAQEAIKACTGKFTPLHQWLYLDTVEVLPVPEEGQQLDHAQFQPRGNRYDAQVICIGSELSDKLAALKIFMIGSGAIGCEMMKNFAMMGLSANPDGKITVTDNDVIEKSNLNRQFLFRPKDIRQPKSTTAANAVLVMNPELHVEPQLQKVGPDTEELYSDSFFKGLDIVVNALDNIAARLYVDSRCVTNQRPLLESGTLSTKGHVQVIVPHLTESYGSRRDPPEKDVPFCTLKSFPNQIEHCIQWARDKFETLFSLQPIEFNKMFDEPDFLEKFRASTGNKIVRAARIVRTIENRPRSFDDCVSWARLRFEKLYPNKIKQLLHSFPLEMTTPEGNKFWSGAKRPPTVIEFNPEEPLHLDFIRYCACLYAKIWGITPLHFDPRNENDNLFLKKVCLGVKIPVFKPKDNKVIETDTSKKKEEVEQAKLQQAEEFDEEKFNALVDKLSGHLKASDIRMFPEDFEKDNDSNFHIDFITATSNLRASNYTIGLADRLKTKRIAGRIMPAIATTTAAVSGLVSLELMKIASGKQLPDYKNTFLNLGVPVFQLAEPFPAEKTQITPSVSITIWDQWDIKLGDITLSQFTQHFLDKYKLTVTGVFQGVQMVYVPIMPGHNKRLSQKMRRLITRESGQKYVDLIVTFEDDKGGDVHGPPVRFWLVGKRRKKASKKDD